ncbi:hypothetical protein G6F35_015914 [Rhizopus arrhizus]|nr:hypothetical protein G6F35_015914 [Rhizopus arrhizus]
MRPAVHQKGVDGEAAREIARAIVAPVVHRDAGGAIGHVIDRLHRKVVQLLPGDHADRLGRFLDGQRQLGRRVHGAGGVGARVFGDRVAFAHDRDGVQHDAGRVALRLARHGHAAARPFEHQSRARQQGPQRLVRRQGARHRGRLHAPHRVGRVGQFQRGLRRQLRQRAFQRLRGDVQGQRRLLRLGGRLRDGQRQQHGQIGRAPV